MPKSKLKKQKKSKEQTTANLFEASASSSEERDLGNDSGEEKVEARAPRKRKRKDKICIAWRKGKCAKGDDCPYAHPNKKTEPAKDSKTENRSLYIKVYASRA